MIPDPDLVSVLETELQAARTAARNARLGLATTTRERDDLRRELALVRQERDEACADAQRLAGRIRACGWSLDQPPPTGDGEPVYGTLVHALASHGAPPSVMAALAERARVGVQRYGTELRAHNGRCAIADEYAEALDAPAYCVQGMLEHEEEHGAAHPEQLIRLALYAEVLASVERQRGITDASPPAMDPDLASAPLPCPGCGAPARFELIDWEPEPGEPEDRQVCPDCGWEDRGPDPWPRTLGALVASEGSQSDDVDLAAWTRWLLGVARG